MHAPTHQPTPDTAPSSTACTLTHLGNKVSTHDGQKPGRHKAEILQSQAPSFLSAAIISPRTALLDSACV